MLARKSVSAVKLEDQQNNLAADCLDILSYSMFTASCGINPVFAKVA